METENSNRKKDVTMLQKRHKTLLVAYIEVIEKYGDHARFISKGQLYQEAGEIAGFTASYSGRIIRKMVREGMLKYAVNQEV